MKPLKYFYLHTMKVKVRQPRSANGAKYLALFKSSHFKSATRSILQPFSVPESNWYVIVLIVKPYWFNVYVRVTGRSICSLDVFKLRFWSFKNLKTWISEYNLKDCITVWDRRLFKTSYKGLIKYINTCWYTTHLLAVVSPVSPILTEKCWKIQKIIIAWRSYFAWLKYVIVLYYMELPQIMLFRLTIQKNCLWENKGSIKKHYSCCDNVMNHEKEEPVQEQTGHTLSCTYNKNPGHFAKR